jgi:hypothetical protein
MRQIVNTQEHIAKARDFNDEEIRFEWRHMNRLIRMGW